MRMRPPDTDARRPTDEALLDRLGLNGSASDDQVEAAHDEIADFLARAPSSLRGWARNRLTEVDEAYVLLRGNGRSGDAATAAPDLLAADMDLPQPTPRSRVAAPPAREPRNGNHARAAMLGDALGGGDWYEPAEPVARVRPSARREPRVRANQLGLAPSDRGGGLRRLGLAAGAVVALGVVGFIGFKLGEPIIPGLTGTPAPQASGATIDQAQISAYMTRIAADPNDVEALQGLANVYFAAGDFATAAIWLDKLLVVEPDNIDALLGAGAVAYNLGRLDDAEDAWLKVLALEPDNVEVHYDLGFLYLAQDPPDLARVEQEWRRVIELDPDSDIAKTVATHLDGIVPPASGSPSESASPAPTSAPSAGT